MREVQAKLIATGRSAPDAVANQGQIEALFDSMGRQVMAPHQMRGFLATAYVALANGTETSLLAGVAGEYHDLLSITAANTSGAAIALTIRESTGGSTTTSIYAAASATTTINFPAPIPQSATDAAWTVDMGDFSNTTVNITALFVKNV
ncbi:MAG: hypothetical protein AABY15_00955 [Nanoarchaeota archaeon]